MISASIDKLPIVSVKRLFLVLTVIGCQKHICEPGQFNQLMLNERHYPFKTIGLTELNQVEYFQGIV